MKVASTICVLFVGLLFALLMVDLAWQGIPGMAEAWAESTPRDGGILAALLSTIAIAFMALCFSLPLALGCTYVGAELLATRPRLNRALRRSLDVASAAPSIAVGLVGWSLFSTFFGLGFSLLAGSLTLTMMLAPLMAAAFLTGVDALPRQLRAQSLALGVSHWQTFWKLIIPSVKPALFAGVVLALGRATAETAVLVLTSGISTRWPEDVFDPGGTLAVHMYHLARNVPGGENRAYAAALLLVVTSLIVQVVLMRLRTETRR